MPYRFEIGGIAVECDTVEEVQALSGVSLNGKPKAKTKTRSYTRRKPAKKKAQPTSKAHKKAKRTSKANSKSISWARVKKEAKRTKFEGDLRKLRSSMAKARDKK